MRFLALNFLKGFLPRPEEDFVDHLNYYYTPLLFLFGSALVGGKQYIAKPIQCWIPPIFTSSMEEYIESYCWLQNTYWIPAHENIPDDNESREERQIGYYQWVPFMLLLQAFMFMAPSFWWRLTDYRFGLNFRRLMNYCEQMQSVNDRFGRQETFDLIAQCLIDMLKLGNRRRSSGSVRNRRSANANCGCCCGTFDGGYRATISYLSSKLIYTLNAVSQFLLLNFFLIGKRPEYKLYGLQVLQDLLFGREWTQSGHFPRVTLCDFEIRGVGNLNRYTVQCALMANIFNEKVFLFACVWLFILSVLTAANFLFWCVIMSTNGERTAFTVDYMPIGGLVIEEQRRFVDYLSVDGVLTLRMIANQTGDTMIREIVARLWAHFRQNYENECVHISPPSFDIDMSMPRAKDISLTTSDE